jgi:hypothetical protein
MDLRTLAALRSAALADVSDVPFYRDALLEAGEHCPSWAKVTGQEEDRWRDKTWMTSVIPYFHPHLYDQRWRGFSRYGVRKYLREPSEWLAACNEPDSDDPPPESPT